MALRTDRDGCYCVNHVTSGPRLLLYPTYAPSKQSPRIPLQPLIRTDIFESSNTSQFQWLDLCPQLPSCPTPLPAPAKLPNPSRDSPSRGVRRPRRQFQRSRRVQFDLRRICRYLQGQDWVLFQRLSSMLGQRAMRRRALQRRARAPILERSG
jgi:hypothetical protein